MRASAAAVTAALGLALLPIPASAAQTAQCQKITTRVSIDPHAPDDRNETVAGTLCTVGKHGTKASVVQLLVHGITYDRSYWDFGIHPEKYSYVRVAHAAGYATLAIDRVGNGESGKPPPESLTTESNAQELQQIVRALKAGQIGGRAFDTVVVVGHSYGAFTSMMAAARSSDIDGLIVSGYGHYVDPRFFTVVPGSLTPAAYDNPQRFGSLPPGYLTSRAGSRPQFYYMPNADPEVVEHDEATKQLTTDGEMSTFPPHHFDSRDVTAPVLLVLGDYDLLFCPMQGCTRIPERAAFEKAAWAKARSFEMKVIADSGHDLNLQRNAHEFFDMAQRWIDEKVASATAGR